jgi:hypothetical protein
MASLVFLMAVAQLGFFLVFMQHPTTAGDDSFIYEEAGYHLFHGEGLSLLFSDYPDESLRDAACARTTCTGELVPTAAYPPGYEFFVALVYAVIQARSLTALVIAQCALNLAMFVVFVFALWRRQPGAAFIGAAIAAAYPFLAHQATFVMSDHLHIVLIFFGFVLLVIKDELTLLRALLAGTFIGLATLTRPYSVMSIPVMTIVVWLKQNHRYTFSGVFALSAALPIVGWSARNFFVFGKLIPFSTTKLGLSLYYNVLNANFGLPKTKAENEAFRDMALNLAGPEALTLDRSHHTAHLLPQFSDVMQQAFFDWFRDHPFEFLRLIPFRTVRMWVSQGENSVGVQVALALFLGSLTLAGFVSLWYLRKTYVAQMTAALIIPYALFLLHSIAMARRTLALRLPLLFATALAASALFSNWSESKKRREQSASVKKMT